MIDILDSPFFPLLLVSLFFIPAMAVIFILKPNQLRKTMAPVIEKFNGTIDCLGTLKFDYKGRTYFLMRISSGRGTYSTAAMLQLVTYLNPEARNNELKGKILIGHPNSYKYTRVRFLNMRKRQYDTIEAGSKLILIGSDMKETMDKLRLAMQKTGDNDGTLQVLFDREFAHITIAEEWHVGFTGLIKRIVFRYTCLPPQTDSDATQLEKYISHTEHILKSLHF